jgi:CRISPR/Cas system CMR-associated protein Cmr5 small subunit
MTHVEAKKFTNQVFDLIKISKTTEDIDKILDTLEIPSKNRMKSDAYPQIKFKFDQIDIDALINSDLIHKTTLTFKNDITEKLSDPLTKLLYSTVWKNGDLKKIKHIIKGAKDVNDNGNEQDDALVFYQFGKYLTKVPGQPIIDQHVIRAYAVYKSTDDNNIETLQKLETLKNTHKTIINDYINWLQSDELTIELKAISDYTYFIDKLLFATGKTIKFVKPKRKKNTRANSLLEIGGV